ncbi:MAG: hypothetical protein LBG19_05630 [Prevotellaceae bacterium]|nr:hypothetical protein [Prevotellaceae bacterium]
MKKLTLKQLNLNESAILSRKEKKNALGGYTGCTDDLQCARPESPLYGILICECGMCWDKRLEHPCPSW